MRSPSSFAYRPATWLTPLIVMLALAVTLPAVYLGGTIDAAGNLRHLPIGLIVEPQTTGSTPGTSTLVADAVRKAVDNQVISLRTVSKDQALQEIGSGELDGAVRVPSDFDAQIAALTSREPGPAVHPTVHLDTAPAAGAMTVGLFTAQLTPVLMHVNATLGQQLTAATATADSATSAARSALSAPFTIVTSPLIPLPAHAGSGTSVFYLALVLVLVGFVGASAMHPLIDSASGFQPNELGPLVRRRPYTHMSRLQLLSIKWALMLTASPAAAALVQLVAGRLLSMPIPHPWHLWAFSTSVIAAIGIGALTVFALFGSVGPLVNMFFFVALAMTSSAGAIPLEAVPPFFHAISHFEPMRPVVKGLRSILYFDEVADSGLRGAWLDVLTVGVAAILCGLAATRFFDRVPTLTRHPEPPSVTHGHAPKHRAAPSHGPRRIRDQSRSVTLGRTHDRQGHSHGRHEQPEFRCFGPNPIDLVPTVRSKPAGPLMPSGDRGT